MYQVITYITNNIVSNANHLQFVIIQISTVQNANDRTLQLVPKIC